MSLFIFVRVYMWPYMLLAILCECCFALCVYKAKGENFLFSPLYSQGLTLYWCKVKIYVAWCTRARTLFMSHCKTTKEQQRNYCKNRQPSGPLWAINQTTLTRLMTCWTIKITIWQAVVQRTCLAQWTRLWANQTLSEEGFSRKSGIQYVIFFQAATRGQHPVKFWGEA